MDVRTCWIVELKGTGDNSVYFPTIQSRTLLDSFTNHLRRKMSMILCNARNQFKRNSDSYKARSRWWEPSNICPTVKWTNNCNRAIVETLNEDFIPEFEDKIAGSWRREDAIILCILRLGAQSWWWASMSRMWEWRNSTQFRVRIECDNVTGWQQEY